MPKILKGRCIYFTAEEYGRIKQDETGRFVFEFQHTDIDEELANKIIIALKDGKTRTYICEEHGLLEIDLNRWFKKTYGTHKITDVRNKINENSE